MNGSDLLNTRSYQELQEKWKEDDGYVLIREAVPKFYALRFSYWREQLDSPLLEGTFNQHQYIWDIRMRPLVYSAFSEVLNNSRLWVDFFNTEPDGVFGLLAVNKVLGSLRSIENNLSTTFEADVGDLLIIDSQRFSVQQLNDSDWLRLRYIPAQEENLILTKQREEQFIKDQTKPVFLSSLGRKLLGVESWELHN
ncbi:hypothetical protein PaeBR_14170 [Paenibacillus sp. BR2-3]|uniref:hypothetical protein n=1 Tax=Paenibacillus sp. BR2-3 TaxID=3048494 RepID=UPI003977B5FC